MFFISTRWPQNAFVALCKLKFYFFFSSVRDTIRTPASFFIISLSMNLACFQVVGMLALKARPGLLWRYGEPGGCSESLVNNETFSNVRALGKVDKETRALVPLKESQVTTN